MDTLTQLENVTVTVMPAILRIESIEPAVIALTPMSAWVRSVVIYSYFVYCLRPLGTVELGCFENEGRLRAVSLFNVDDGPGIDFSLSRVLGLSNPQTFLGLGDAYEVSYLYSFPSYYIVYNIYCLVNLKS